MYVCICNAVNEKCLKLALSEGKQTISELRHHFEFKTCCGKCTGHMRSMIDDHLQCLLKTQPQECSYARR